MRRIRAAAAALTALMVVPTPARAETVSITYIQALTMARGAAPDLRIAQANVTAATAGIGVAGIWPNPTVLAGTNTQTAKISLGVAAPLPIFGQLGSGKEAARAELATVKIESEIAHGEVRAQTAHAFVGLWLAERTAGARRETATLAKALEDSVKERVDAGNAPEVELLRVRAERLRADADATESTLLVDAARIKLGRWIGAPSGGDFATSGEPDVPASVPTLATLELRLTLSPTVRRERADAYAAEARAAHERALIRPIPVIELGMDMFDPTLPATNYRATLGLELPIFSWRGPIIAREEANAEAAKARAATESARLRADLASSYATFQASSGRVKAYEDGVVPAADAAAAAMEESYSLGRAALVAVLDARRARNEARVALIEARGARANAWIDIEHLLGEK